MPFNKHALKRYLAIDAKLRLPGFPTLDDLIDFVSEKLDMRVSRRTIQFDLFEMRYCQVLSFEAPIKVMRKLPVGQAHAVRHSRGQLVEIRKSAKNGKPSQCWYKYDDPDYSLPSRLAQIAESFNAPAPQK